MGFRFLMKFNPIIRKHFKSRNPSPLSSSYVVKNCYAALNSELYDRPDFKIDRRWHTGHAHHHGGDHDSGEEGERIFRLGLAADIGLTAGKAVTGYISGSTAIIADAAHSLSDVVLSGVALLSFKAARVPKDKEHPYGHGKFETLGALGISGVLIATSGGIAFHAFSILWDILTAAAPSIVDQSIAHSHAHDHQHSGHHHEIDMEHPVLALNMIVISIAIKEGLYWITKRAGEKTGSGLMKANAWHHRADAVSSLVALIGVGGSILGVRFLDPLAGLVVSGMIFKAGLVSGYQSVMELVDAAVPSESLEPYKRTIMEIEGVKGFSRLRGRRAGSSLYLDADILVDPFTSVSAAHDVGENVCHQLQQSHPEVAEVFIHIVFDIKRHVEMLILLRLRKRDPDQLTEHQLALIELKHDQPATSQVSPSLDNHTSSDHQFNTATSEQTDIEDNVANILSFNFSEKMVVERIMRHSLQGQVYLEVYVSMPPDILIREAVKTAEEAEKKILETVPNVSHVFVHLRLGRPMPEL